MHGLEAFLVGQTFALEGRVDSDDCEASELRKRRPLSVIYGSNLWP